MRPEPNKKSVKSEMFNYTRGAFSLHGTRTQGSSFRQYIGAGICYFGFSGNLSFWSFQLFGHSGYSPAVQVTENKEF
jgi:hypothetical protein